MLKLNPMALTNNKKINLLHVWSSFKGDYPLFNQVVQELDPARYCHVVCYLTGPLPEDEALTKAGFDVRTLPFSRKGLRGFRPRALRQLREIIFKEDISVIHAHRHKATVYASLASIGSRARLVATIHGQNRWRSVKRRLTNRVLWRRVNRIVAVSEAVRQDILSSNPWLPEERVTVIYNGIDVKTFATLGGERRELRRRLGLPEDKWIWGTAGRLTPVKGHEVLLHAWAQGKLGERGGYLVLAGDGRLKEDLTALARRLGIDSEVSFLGHVKDIPSLLMALNAFVFPSFNEGLPLALLEALSAGLPTVASCAGGIPEVLQPLQERGLSLLVPSGEPQALADAMNTLMSWEKERYSYACQAARGRALDFDKSEMLRSLDRLYSELLMA